MAGVQIGLGIYYIRYPVNCARSKYLTYLMLIGGCCSVIAMLYLSFYCRRSGSRSVVRIEQIHPRRPFGEDEEERLIQ